VFIRQISQRANQCGTGKSRQDPGRNRVPMSAIVTGRPRFSLNAARIMVPDCSAGTNLAYLASMASVTQRLYLDLALRPAVAAVIALAPAGLMRAYGETASRPPGEVPYLNYPGGTAPVFTPAAPASAAPPAGTASPTAKRTTTLDALKRHDRELQEIQSKQRKSRAVAARLKREIESIGDDRRKLNRQLIAVAARVRAVEAQIAEIEERLKPLDEKKATLRKSLDARRDLTAGVLAALQRIGRNPPPALVVTPEDALESVRSAMLLGAALPEMRHEVETLVAELSELAQVRRDIAAERSARTRNLTALAEDQARLTLLTEQRQKQQAEITKSLAAERQRAAELGRQAENVQDLIVKLEQNLDPATRAARRGSPSAVERTPNGRRDFVALKDPGRMAPAVAFAEAKRMLPRPVNGVRIRDYGASDGLGGHEKGVSIATRPGAQITAPCDGWVVYSGPFRNYGQLLILNAGGGYHVLLAGMERISVDLGQFVVMGEPVAVMGGRAQAPAAIAVGAGQPVLYVEFRKDGTPIDPTPWWATSDSEKVRG
jgi:murein hydrolase activator